MILNSNKQSAYELVKACEAHNVKHIIISPGSRNAPLTLTFARNMQMKCYSIVDERVAAFFALGVSQQTKEIVALVCTSGTAMLNYGPAIAEAYYQNIPLLVISADRPKELRNQEIGQAINQENIFQNIVERSYQFPDEGIGNNQHHIHRLCNEALYICKQSSRPVHINIPFWEPLYGTKSYANTYKPLTSTTIQKQLTTNELESLAKSFNKSPNILILIGFMPENSLIEKLLSQLAEKKGVVVLTETIANLKNRAFHYNIDRLLDSMQDVSNFSPEILISFGGTIISKKIKNWLQKNKPKEHWHINERDYFIDTYQSLTKNISVSPATFFEQLLPYLDDKQTDFSTHWDTLECKAEKSHRSYIEQIEWSDLQAFHILLEYLPQPSLLQLGNSTVVRYHQLFTHNPHIQYASNRGVSGIDGSTSTAVGASFIYEGFTTLITGDISFGYDSNAMWHQYISPKLRIIVINNGGGGIFRFLEGSSKTEELEEFFETKHSSHNFEYWARQWNIHYEQVNSKDELVEVLARFYTGNTVKMIEIKTPSNNSATILRNYFEALKE